MVAELIYGSEVMQDAHESHHATVAKPRATDQFCPVCQFACSVWIDRHGTPSHIGCRHVARTVMLGGVLQLEFTTPAPAAFGPGQLPSESSAAPAKEPSGG